MKVTEIMTKKPVCCFPSSSTVSAALLMQETDTGILPVVQDPFTPTLVGVVTDRDLCLHVVAADRNPSSTWIDGCMTHDPVCCTEQDDVSRALELMETHQIRRLPVVNEKHEVAGILSLSDLVCKAGIEASDIATTCGASASLSTHVNSTLACSLRRLDGCLLLLSLDHGEIVFRATT